MIDLRLYLLGMPRIERQGNVVKIERRKALALVAYLALVEQPQSRDVLANLLWPNLDYDHARSALRSTLHALKTSIPGEWISSDRSTLMLKRDLLWVDINEFSALQAKSRTHGHGVDTVCDACVQVYTEAIALYQTDFLDGFSLSDCLEFEDWQAAQREWSRREFADLLHHLSEYYARTQRYDLAIKHAQEWLAVDGLNEPAHRQLMRLYAANGQRSEALRQYQQCVDILDEELVTFPDEETNELYQMIQNSQLAPSPGLEAPPLPNAYSIMPPLPILTIGRQAALQEIKQRLGIGNSAPQAITVIQGWPGVGKSTTAAMLAHDPEIASQFPDGVLWTSLGEHPSISTELASWATALHIGDPGHVSRTEGVSAKIMAVLRDRRVLLIVDDIWQVEHGVPFRLGGHSCALVVTTRLNDVANALAPTPNDIYRLPVLSEAAGLELLQKLTPETVAKHYEEARELVRDLEGLPLALQVAGRLLHSEARLGWGVRELLTELKSSTSLLNSRVPSDVIGAGHDLPPTVAALLNRSTDLLNAETRRWFAYLGLFAPKPATFDLEAMAAVWDREDPRQIARILVNRGLLEPISGGRFQMHALLVMHARALLEQEGDAL